MKDEERSKDIDDAIAFLWHESQLDKTVIRDAGVLQRAAMALDRGLHRGAAERWPRELREAGFGREEDVKQPILPLSKPWTEGG